MLNGVGLVARNAVANGLLAVGNGIAAFCDNGSRRMVDSVKGPELERIDELEREVSELRRQNGELRDELAHYKDEYEQAVLHLEPLYEENSELRERMKQVPDEWVERVKYAEDVLEMSGVPHDSDPCYVSGEKSSVYHLNNACSSLSGLNCLRPFDKSTVGEERGKRRACGHCGSVSFNIESIEALFGLKAGERLVTTPKTVHEPVSNDECTATAVEVLSIDALFPDD